MEFIREEIQQNNKKSSGFMQITIDDDYIVKDTKPDVIRILQTEGVARLEEKRISGDSLWISGNLEFMVLYRSDDSLKKLDMMEGSISFQEKIRIDELKDTDLLDIQFEIEDLSISIVNSRKIAVRAVVDLSVVQEETTVDAPIKEVIEERNLQQKQKEHVVACLKETKQDSFRTKSVIPLPKSKPNIAELVCYWVDLRNQEKLEEEQGIVVRGDAYLCVLYRSLEGQLEWFETMVPYSGRVAVSGKSREDIFFLQILQSEKSLDIVNDYDGEPRSLELELTFLVQAKLWEERKFLLLSDAYSLEKELILKETPMIFNHLLVHNHAKVRLMEQMKLEEKEVRILQICCFNAKVHIEKKEIIKQGLLVTASLVVNVFYATSEDQTPFTNVKRVCNFEQLVDVPGLDMNSELYMDTCIDQLQVNLLAADEFEVKATIGIEVLAFESESVTTVLEVEEEERPKEWDEIPGMVSYRLQKDETLWDVAKRFHTTIGSLKMANQIQDELVRCGDKLLIVKTFEEC